MPKGKTILVPLDGSELAESVLPYAEALGQTGGARLVLVRVAHARGRPGVDPADDQVRALDEAREYLEQVARRLEQAGVTVESAVPYGNAAEMILTEVRLRRPDLIVMATHGRTGLRRALFGSVADQVQREAGVPLLCAPANARPSLPADRELRVLVPLDGSSRSEQILAPVEGLAEAMPVRLLLLGIATQDRPSNDQRELQAEQLLLETGAAGLARDRVEDHLERLAATLRGRGRTVEVNAVTGDPDTVILDEARAQQADLIAMATHGRSGLERVRVGSVTEKVLARAHLPMLLLRPSDLE